jgi:hypothetical protein
MYLQTQKEALEGGLVTMEDIQMMAADEAGMLLSFSTLILAYL